MREVERREFKVESEDEREITLLRHLDGEHQI